MIKILQNLSNLRAATTFGPIRKALWTSLSRKPEPSLEICMPLPQPLRKSDVILRRKMGFTEPEPSLVPTEYWRQHVRSREEIARMAKNRMLTGPLSK